MKAGGWLHHHKPNLMLANVQVLGGFRKTTAFDAYSKFFPW